MSGRDEDLDLLLDGLAQVERDAYQKGLGEHLAAMLDAGNQGKEDPAGSIFDAVGRAKIAKEGEAGLGHGDDAA